MIIPNKPTEDKFDFKLEVEAISDKGIKYLITFISHANSFLMIKAVNKENLRRHFDEVLNRLESNIISEWRQQVNIHWDSNPITEIEKSLKKFSNNQ